MRMITIFILIVAGAVLATSTGCETVKGLGKDIHDASSSVQHAFVE